MVKVKKAVNVVPSKAEPLKKTIKKKSEQKKEVAKKVVADIGTEQPAKSLVALPKKAKKSKIVEENVKPEKVKKIKIAEENVEPKKEKQKKNKPLEESVKQKKSKLAEQPAVEEPTTKKSKKSKTVPAENLEKSKQKPKLAKKPPKPAVSVKIVKNGKIQKPIPNKAAKQKNKQKSKGNPDLAKVPIKLTITTEDLPPFNAEEFKNVLSLANIKKIAQSLKKIVEAEVNEKKNALFSDYRYLLNLASFKIPDCPKRMVKLNVKYSLINKEEDDVLIVVPDLQRGAKVDYEPTIEHYTNLFNEHGVTGLGYRLKIMPFTQLRKEFRTFEAVRKLAASYEHFLCEGRIVGHVVGFVGKIFQKPRLTFHAVHLDKVDKMMERIQKALCRTAYKQLHKGDLTSIPVGNHLHTAQQLAENVECVVEQLNELYPGGWANIRNMHLKIDIGGTSALPLFVSNCKPPTHTPFVVGPKEKRMIKMKREANAVLEKFNIDKKGDLNKLSKKQSENKQKALEHRKAMMEEKKGTKKLLLTEEDNEDEVKPAKKLKFEEKSKKKNKQEKVEEEIKQEVEEDDNDDEEAEFDDEFVDEINNDDDDDDNDDDDDDDDEDDDDDDDDDDDE